MNNLNNDFIKYLPSTIKELYLYYLNINDECLNNFPTTLNYVEFYQNSKISDKSFKLFKERMEIKNPDFYFKF